MEFKKTLKKPDDPLSLKYYEKYFGSEFRGKDFGDDLIFYRKGYEFLVDEDSLMRGIKLRNDRLICPPGSLYQYKEYSENRKTYPKIIKRNLNYFKREFDSEQAEKSFGLFNNYIRLENKRFRKVWFERIIGFEMGKNLGDYICHTFSGGMEFFGLSLKFPKDFRNELENIMASGIAELHNNNIEYSDPLPTNLRYNFDGKIILNPHESIQFHKNILSPLTKNRDCWGPIERDLGVLLYTHDWIENCDSFIVKYLNVSQYKLDFSSLKKGVYSVMRSLEGNSLGGISSKWQERGKLLKTAWL